MSESEAAFAALAIAAAIALRSRDISICASSPSSGDGAPASPGWVSLGRRIRSASVVGILRRGFFLHLRLAEEQIKTIAERLLFLLALGERQQQRVAQNAAVGKSDIGHRFHGIDAFRGRYPNAGAASRPEETMQLLAHQPNTPCRPALATKLVTCGIVVSMSASYFRSTLSVSLTVS